MFVIVAVQSEVWSQEQPIKLATEAYLSVKGDEETGELNEGRPENASTSIQRMNWIPESEKPLSYFSKAPINHFTWREQAISFTPRKSGTVTLELYGPWEKSSGSDIYRQDVYWDDVRLTGATLANGGFENPLNASDSSWKSTGGARITASKDVPSAEGTNLVKTWHNERVLATFSTTAGKPVTVRVKARAVKPIGFDEMRRIAERDTPAHKAAKRLRRGANLGNHLEVAPGQNWAIEYDDKDYDHIKETGFDHVRLPIGWHHYAGPAPDFRLSETIFAKVDKHVERAMQRKLSIIINIHHFDDFTTDPKKNTDQFAAIWRQIAEHYAKSPESVFFELLNEPKDAATTLVLNPIIADVIHQIRQTNPTRTILIGPGQWNSISELANLKLPDDDRNLIVSVHNYDPFQFTHQGATWAGPDVVALKLVRFPGPPAKPLIPESSASLTQNAREWLARYNTITGDANPCSEASIKELVTMAKSWAEYYGRPIHFGEFGAYIEADPESRANYVRTFRQAFDDSDLGWALWDWKAGFRYWDATVDAPAPGFKEALFPQTKKK